MLSLHQNSITRSSILNLLVPWTWPFVHKHLSLTELAQLLLTSVLIYIEDLVYLSFHSEHTTWCSWSFISSMILYSSECEFWYMITCSTLVSLLETSSLLRNILFFINYGCKWVIISFSYLSSGRRAYSNLLLYHKMCTRA